VKPRYIDVGYSANVNLRSLHDQYYNTYPPRTVVVFTVSSYVFSNAYYAPAMDVGYFPGDWEIYLINNGHIRGAGGNGGDYDADNATPGGTALFLRNYISIQNNGTIYGGGGGGGGASWESAGGSGGAGVIAGVGGWGWAHWYAAPAGSEYSGGAGITYANGSNGGRGGDVGQPGQPGTNAGAAGASYVMPGKPPGYCWDGGGYIKSFGVWDSARNIWTNTGNPGAYVGPGA
jgi:hypothetical protein